jgi:stage II sporulation protein M
MFEKRRFSLREEYARCWNYIKKSKNFIFIIIAIFFVFTLVGFFVSPSGSLLEEILKFIQELLEKTSGMSHFELIRFIFLNNLGSSFFGMILGLFLGIFPVISIVSNGYLLGFVSSLSVENNGLSILYKLLPHGIFELPAIFISLGLGLRLGTFIFRKDRKETLKEYILESLRVFLFIVIPLLIIAAIIEGSLIFFSG